MLRPRLRALEIVRHDAGDRPGIVLRDPSQVMADAVFVPLGLVPLLELFDGSRTAAQIAQELTRAHGTPVPATFVARIAHDLEERLCLEGERYQRALRDHRARFTALPARLAAHAGSAGYPEDPALLAGELDRVLAEGQHRTAPTPSAPPRALLAPHIDLARGRRSYAEAYRALAAAPPPDLFVLLGTAHAGPAAPLLPTGKDFVTPLGRVGTDVDFVARVAQALGPTAWDEEFLHAEEHSLEFQVLFLQHLFGDTTLRIAPFLCGALPASGTSPGGEGYVEQLVAAFQSAARAHGGSVCFVAGADLAHVGPHFGDPAPLAAPDLDTLRRADLTSLEHCAAGDAEAFFASVMADGNQRRVCGTTPIYLMLRAAGNPRGELVHYEQSVSAAGELCVSHAAMVFPG